MWVLCRAQMFHRGTSRIRKHLPLLRRCSEASQTISTTPTSRSARRRQVLISSLLLSSLELSDTQVYEPYIRARLGTAVYFCQVVPTIGHRQTLEARNVIILDVRLLDLHQARAELVTLIKDIQPPDNGRSRETLMKRPGFIMIPPLALNGSPARHG